LPSSISTVRLVGVPSSSIDSEPRREAMVPSSTTVTPFAATCWPISPAKADVFLRLKSPSSPWPTASCSMTPGQPLDRTMSKVLAVAIADHHRHVDPDQWAVVAHHLAVGAHDLDMLPGGGERGRHLPHARVL